MDDSEKKSVEKGGGGPGGGCALTPARQGGGESKVKLSLLEQYPDGRSKVTTSGEESRVELMEKILDMDDEISDILKELRRKEEEAESLSREVRSLRSQMTDIKEKSRRTELDLLQEMDMLHDKNSVMSNLLDIINERAEAAEEELERRIQNPSQSPARSASNVSQVSALSDTSTGSDEVFLLQQQHGKEGVVIRDWEAKLKVRIESLERLLAEERQKVTTAEKKLLLAGIDSLSPSVSDDVKLRMREKELLQEELLKNQRHLHIATDQIQGLKERLQILEEEYQRLKDDYAKLYDDIDKPRPGDNKGDNASSDSDKTPESFVDEHPFLVKKVSVVEAPQFREVQHGKAQTETVLAKEEHLVNLQEELSAYRDKAKELEYQLEEINDIWRSKSSASDKEKDELEKQLKEQLHDMNTLEETIETLRRELRAKDKLLSAHQEALKEKENDLARHATIAQERDQDKKQHAQDKETLENQLSQRDASIRDLNERIRNRDERLAEKDGILCKLNEEAEEQKQQAASLNERVHDVCGQLQEKEVMISVLRGQISPASPVRAGEGQLGLQFCQTDAEKENCRLREALRQQQVELERVAGEKRHLGEKREESERAMEGAAMLWEGERGEMQKEMNILQEKVRMYEAYNNMCRDETIECLKQEAQDYFREREALTCQLSTLKLKHDSALRQHREALAKLQGELSEKLQELKAEVDNNTHLNSEMEKLTRQAELAYRLQQEERLLRAEHQAMKVRYETRIDKLNKEANKMLMTITKIQKERDLDKEIISKMQDNFNAFKDRYTEDSLKAEDDRALLERHIKEIEQSRSFVDKLQKQLRELREKCTDQDRLRVDLINQFATDRASWEIDRANLTSTINQLEERLSSTSNQQARHKDIQVNMGMAWDKERTEQRRLLQEAHNLALDLQEQLRSRDETFAHERKELMRQLESDRQSFSRDRRDSEKLIVELENRARKVNSLQQQLTEVEKRGQKESDSFSAEKVELLKQLAECKHAQSRDYRKLEELLAGFNRLREYGTMLAHGGHGAEQSEEMRKVDQKIVEYVKEAICQISEAADELSRLTNQPHDANSAQFVSQTNAVKNEMSKHLETQHGDVIIATDVTSSRATVTSRIEEQANPVSRRINTQQLRDAAGQRDTERVVLETSTVLEDPPTVSSSSSGILKKDPSITHKKLSDGSAAGSCAAKSQGWRNSPAGTTTLRSPGQQQPCSSSSIPQPLPQPPVAVVLRSFDPAMSRRYDRPPSYTSGTRSASASRATTPEMSSEGSFNRRSGLPDPPPSFVMASNRSHLPGTQQEMFQKALTSVLSSTSGGKRTKRPSGWMKSLSIDGSSANQSGARPLSASASSTPTHPVTSADLVALFANQNCPTTASSLTSQMTTPTALLYRDNFSPRTARRKFFEEPNLFQNPPYPQGYLSLPERGGGGTDLGPPAHHQRQTSLPDAEAMRREAEETHQRLSSPTDRTHQRLPSSTSWDETIQHSAAQPISHDPKAPYTSSCEGAVSETISSTAAVQTANAKPPSAKDKRKMFKKANSLESTVGTSIAKAGVSAISPGAPTGLFPSDIFAAVKGKLKPVFKKKSGTGKGQDVSGTSTKITAPSGEVTDGATGSENLVPEGYLIGSGAETTRDQEENDEVVAELPSDRSRGLGRRADISGQKAVPGGWRSKSEDRVGQRTTQGQQGPADAVQSSHNFWKFNETAV